WAASIALSSGAFLAILKFAVGVTSGSKGCIADSLHSAIIFVMALAIILGRRLAGKEENSKFHYGYGKIEAVVTGSITFLIACGGAVLVWNSVKHLMNAPQYGPPHLSALLMALTSIIANEMLARYLLCVGTQSKTRSILANAWAYRENLISSIIVFVGIIGAELGLGVLDPIAAILVVALITKSCTLIVLDSVKALMDYSVNGTYGKKVRTIVEAVDGVQRIAALRTRQIGHKIWLDLDICVSPGQSIREANHIAQKVREALLNQIADIDKVIVAWSPLEEDRC
ncbi:MAG TPA: cation transporter, partial [Deltaproteobacteria bacterium]|nr:cation transporter [Deltaproteobacteria bacterium]